MLEYIRCENASKNETFILKIRKRILENLTTIKETSAKEKPWNLDKSKDLQILRGGRAKL